MYSQISSKSCEAGLETLKLFATSFQAKPQSLSRSSDCSVVKLIRGAFNKLSGLQCPKTFFDLGSRISDIDLSDLLALLHLSKGLSDHLFRGSEPPIIDQAVHESLEFRLFSKVHNCLRLSHHGFRYSM